MQCHTCRHKNRTQATFCSHCGRRLHQTADPFSEKPVQFPSSDEQTGKAVDSPPPVPTAMGIGGAAAAKVASSSVRRKSGWLRALFLVAIILVVTNVGRRVASKHWPASWTTTEKHQRVYLDADKTKALFSLLALDDVRVVVNESNGSFQLTGSPAEVSIVEQFSDLIEQRRGKNRSSGHDEWMTEQTYELRSPKAKLLSKVFAFSDIPVFTIRDGDKRLQITASRSEMQIIDEFITQVLDGKQVDSKARQYRRR